MDDGLVEVGRTGRAHGVRGEISVHLVTDRTERLDVGARLLVGPTWCTVRSARRTNDRWLVAFEEIDDRDAAERLAHLPLRAEALDERDGGLYVDELIGAEVVEVGGTARGRCVAVVANPAHDLLELADGSLVPVVFVVGVEPGVVTIDPPEGLFDLT